MAEPATAPALGAFDRDTAVRRQSHDGSTFVFAADVSPEWRAGRGPHGGYLAAMLLRALVKTVADHLRSPRSLTIHYARAPDPGPVTILTSIERSGRSLSTLSARMEQDGKLVALALAAFSVPWNAQEIADLPMPEVAAPDPAREPIHGNHGAPLFTRHLLLQPRIGAAPFSGSDEPMAFGAWLGLVQPRPIDALTLAFFCDALLPTPFIRLTDPAVSPTVDLTIHFRTAQPDKAMPDPEELCFARSTTGVLHEGFFDEDCVIWAPDGTVLAQSRQLALVIPLPSS
ncbi:MAG TPA: thioesterase family protein [Solirubrobacteraceae bacterium]|nr:thioesterase family protein [Solirubrobacteraceae bacterium]